MTSGNLRGIFRKFDEDLGRYALTQSDAFYMQQIPKYVFELTLVIIGISCGVFFFLSDSFSRSIGVLTLILASTIRILPSLLRLQGSILYLKASFGESSELFSTLEVIESEKVKQENRTNRNRLVNAPYVLPEVIFENVSFRFSDSDRLVLKDLSFRVNSGEIFLLEGKSGSGKTTIGDLLLNLLDPTDGQIKYRLSNSHKLIMSYMPQDTILFNGSLRENIALGIEPELINEDRVLELMHLLHLFDFSPEGSNTVFGVHGLTISGGQRQRIGVARALYNSPNLLVFDEPTTALDNETEKIVIEALNIYNKQATTVIISHQGAFAGIANQKLTLTDLKNYD
jgi:ABC-type multidrug transport system fused ATPase/permease subunit